MIKVDISFPNPALPSANNLAFFYACAQTHTMVNVVICSSGSMAANKSRKWQEICQSSNAERCLTKKRKEKRGPRNTTAFHFNVKPQRRAPEKEAPWTTESSQTNDPDPNLIQVGELQNSRHGETNTVFRPVLRDHLEKAQRHLHTREGCFCWKANPLEHINTTSIWSRASRL